MTMGRKPKEDCTVTISLTLPDKMVRRMDAELERTRRMAPLMIISRSQFYAHGIGEWLGLLVDPATQPTLPTRVRTRPTNPRACARLTKSQVRMIRRDDRPAAHIARDLGCDRATVSRVQNGETWAKVN